MKSKQVIQKLRKEYLSAALDEKRIARDPLVQFARWFAEAVQTNAIEPNAMTLATRSPSARVVLLKEFDERGFVFFTNYRSRKGRDLAADAKACLLFWWPQLERQVRIEGRVGKVTRIESETYFHSRPRESQIGAWASAQSSVIKSRAVLEKKFAALVKKFGTAEIPLPPYWGGYRLKPVTIEFWQGRQDRLHDRIRYSRKGRQWKTNRLSP